MRDPRMDPATELLDVVNEVELDRYVRTLVGRAESDTGVTLSPQARRTVADSLVATARATVPTLTLLSRGPGDVPGRAEGSVASTAARVYGVELEGLSAEDRDLEIAREFVALVRTATARAAGEPVPASSRAVLRAARIDVPGPAGRPAAEPSRRPVPPSRGPGGPPER